MGALIPFVLGLLLGVALTLFLIRKGQGDRRDLTAPPPRAAPRTPEIGECPACQLWSALIRVV